MKYKESIVRSFFLSEGLPEPFFEWHHIPERQFRLDVAFPDSKVGVEVQGGIFCRKASHSSIKGILRDMEKHNLEILNGWKVIRVIPQDLCLVDTVNMIKQLIELQKGKQ